LSFEFGPGAERAVASVAEPPAPVASPAQEAPPVPQEVAVVPPPSPPPPPDRDGDGVPDAVDNCPDVPGPPENDGCPVYKKIAIKKEKLELREKLFFATDKATLQPASYGVLDEVVQALTENKSLRVQVQGHTDSRGSEHYNQILSQHRAMAVIDYLVAHGIARNRFDSKGFAFSAPNATNETSKGRATNRHVEFMTLNIIDRGTR
jgi:OOP family OmpA-OmpF porin